MRTEANIAGNEPLKSTDGVPEPLLIEMGIGWTRNPKDRTKLTSAVPRDYVAEIERLRNWSPIETAPKDATPVLVFVPVNRPERRILTCSWSDDDGGWWICGGAMLLGPPSHWKPLPEPPKELL